MEGDCIIYKEELEIIVRDSKKLRTERSMSGKGPRRQRTDGINIYEETYEQNSYLWARNVALNKRKSYNQT
jgi:hypothetical protein